jgi:uncharacterized protein (TIGR04255 family)
LKPLSSKPLVEALVEIRWGEEGQPDPAYPIIVGRLFERLRPDYPEIEALPLAQVPAELATHMVRHRFRRASENWPLVQVGPGVLTFNETDGYHWDDFSQRAKGLMPMLFETHPNPRSLVINSVLLRYINALAVDYSSENLLVFLSSKLHTSLTLPSEAFSRTGVADRPVSLAIQLAFPAREPKGTLALLFGNGTSKGKPALVWEIHVRSTGSDVPRMPEAFGDWLDSAHGVAEEWFFELAKGELLRLFQGAQP